jgi:general secretion pathway protein K
MTAALRTGLRARRGVALIAALWLVIAIATVALQLSLDAHERRALGLAASERGIEQAAANGALVLVQAKLDQALRTTPSGTGAAVMRASDPWLGVDSIYSGAWSVDSMPVDVQIRDLGAQLNVNLMSEAQLRTFFDWILKDDLTANKITQCILDWRDADSIPRPSGAERDQYIRDERLALPANAPFREVSDLRHDGALSQDARHRRGQRQYGARSRAPCAARNDRCDNSHDPQRPVAGPAHQFHW